MKKSNISIFVPHKGCPNCCSFCNQRTISGETRDVSSKDVEETVLTAINSDCSADSEIAFFGGSFTAIDKAQMISLLQSAYPFVKSGRFSGIRVSTRPDAIDEEKLEILKKYGVTAIELGAQSMNDEVLSLNDRGHSSKDVETASKLIKEHGFSLGLQMMTGLYGSNAKLDEETFDSLVLLHPDTLRIYPTITLKGTRLAELFDSGKYIPPTLEETVSLCTKLVSKLQKTDIKLIRLGLHSSDMLECEMVAGPYHQAFGELVFSRMFYNEIMKKTEAGKYTVLVNPSDVSKAVGQNRENIVKLKDNGRDITVKADATVSKNTVRIL